MKFRSLIVIILIFPLAVHAAKKSGDCWELLITTPHTKAATQEFIRMARVAENIFGTALFSFKTNRSARTLSSAHKAILLEWVEDVEGIGPGSEHSYEDLAAAISSLPRVQGIFFSKSPSVFQEIILERDLKEGEIIVVPADSGLSASKMTMDSPIPAFASDANGKGAAYDLFRSPCLFIYGEASDFESVYPLREAANRDHEREVNFGPGTRFKILKVIFHSDDSAGTFFLKQI